MLYPKMCEYVKSVYKISYRVNVYLMKFFQNTLWEDYMNIFEKN